MSDRICSLSDCNGPHVAKGYCRRHYNRLWYTGSLDVRVPPSVGTVPSGEYTMVVRHGHPLAGSRGRVLLHRVILYEAIGPGPHPCHWCRTPLQWDAPRYSPHELQTDHLNQDRSDNSVPNLVPSCGPCNTSRSAVTRRAPA